MSAVLRRDGTTIDWMFFKHGKLEVILSGFHTVTTNSSFGTALYDSVVFLSAAVGGSCDEVVSHDVVESNLRFLHDAVHCSDSLCYCCAVVICY